MISVKYTFKEIAEKYKEHLKYKSLCLWKRQDKIKKLEDDKTTEKKEKV
jgi:hypothetical protein